MTKIYENVSINNLENSEVEITGSITAESFSKYIEESIKSVKEGMEVPGFRKGKAPDSVVIENVGEHKIMREAAQEALRDAYPEILKENETDAIGAPEVSITKMAKDNPLDFKIKTAISPKVDLPDYKKIAKEIMVEEKEEDLEATEEELNEVIENIKKARKTQNAPETGKEDSSGVDEEKELTDEFVKSIGNFESIEDFKTKIKENIKEEKKHRKRDEKRVKTLEKIIEESKMEIPSVLVESELEKMVGVYKDDLENRFGRKFEDYLKEIKKTEEEFRDNLKGEAEKRAKIQVALNNIAEKEEISVPEEEVSKNLETVMRQYPNADKNAARIYVDTALTNEKVYQILENNF